MSELEEVSFWPGSSDGSYSRVGHAGSSPVVTCRRRTVLIVVAVVAVTFLIAVAIPAGLLQREKNINSAANADSQAAVQTAKPPAVTTTRKTATVTTQQTPGSAQSTPTTTTPTPVFPLWREYRLPRNVVPRIYDLSIDLGLFGNETDLLRHSIPYSGTVLIVVDVENVIDNKLVVLHAKEMDVSSAQVAKVEAGTGYAAGDFKDVVPKMTNDDNEQLEIKLNEEYKKGDTLALKIKFNNTMVKNKRHGLYSSTYTVDEKTKRMIATTQFESVFARKAFPCFDEPNFKARFSLKMSRPANMKTLFNTPLSETEDVDGDPTKQRDVFGLSPVMSTYLVAFVVSDFEGTPTRNYTSISNKTVEITVYGQAKQIPYFNYAAQVAEDVLKAYEEFFQIAYPLPKLDMVAIPDFAAGAMENWGLITYREDYLLYEEGSSSSSHKKFIAYIVAHEIAHQWFGNLVTMNWWNDLWLNEGFATFVGQLIGSKAADRDDEWDLDYDFKANVAASFQTDGLLTSHPLSQDADKVETLADIEAMFDSITYTKGAAIINMLYEYVKANVTKDALHNYLTTYAKANANAADLWKEFDSVYPNTEKTGPDNITDMMTSWTATSGHPVLHVTTSTDGFTVNQSQFYLCPTCNRTGHTPGLWKVPLAYQTLDSAGNRLDSSLSYLKTDKIELPEDKVVDSILLNTGWSGYYHVKYGQRRPKKDKLTDVDLGNMAEDMLLLFRGGEVEPDEYVSFLDEVVKSPNSGYLTWKMLLKSLWYLLDIYGEQSENYSTVSNKVYKWLNVGSLNVSYDALEEMNIPDRTILISKLSMALSIDHVKVSMDIPLMKDLSDSWLENVKNQIFTENKVIYKDIHRVVGECGFKFSQTDETWGAVFGAYKNDSLTSSLQLDFRAILASGDNALLLGKYLDYSLNTDKVREQESASIISMVAANRFGRLRAWDFVQKNWPTLLSRYQDEGFTMNRLISSTTNSFSDPFRLEEMEKFFGSHEVGTGKRAAKQALEIVEANIYMMNTQSHDLLLEFSRLDD